MFFRRKPNIRRLARRHDVTGLIAALHYRDLTSAQDGRPVDLGVSIRTDAAEALGAIGDPLAVTALVQAARTEESPSVLRAVVRALDGHYEPQALEALIDALCTRLEPQYERIRTTIDEHLRAAPLETLPVLVHVLLKRSSENGLTPPERRALKELIGEREEASEVVAGAMISHLGDRDEALAGRAADALVVIAPQGQQQLIEGLSNQAVAAKVVEVIARRPGGGATEELIELLDSEDPGTRSAAAVALGQLRDPVAADALLRAVNDERPEVRVAAGAAVDRLGSVAVIVSIANSMRRFVELTRGDRPAEFVSGTVEHRLGPGSASHGEIRFADPGDEPIHFQRSEPPPEPPQPDPETLAKLEALEAENERLRGLERQRMAEFEREIDRLKDIALGRLDQPGQP
jgi:HEAT repeat protein